jgi:hypothetical protein
LTKPHATAPAHSTKRQRHPETAEVLRAAEIDAAVVLIDDVLRDRQTQTMTGGMFVESQPRRIDTGAVVLHDDPQTIL